MARATATKRKSPIGAKKSEAIVAKHHCPAGAPRIFLVDDQEEMLQTVATIVEDQFEIVGLAEDGRSALQLVRTLIPDVLVIDIFMPLMNGIETAMRLKASGLRIKVLFLTAHGDPDFLAAAMASGAQGYVLKPRFAIDLVPALCDVLAGRTFVSPSMHLVRVTDEVRN
jgi:DNA-binding NarL/FixJ family response regulator